MIRETTYHATQIEAAGYMIQDNQGNAIYGIGATVDEAWAMVVDGVGTFFDAYGNNIPADQAYETQFKTYGATATLIAQVKSEGGAIAWAIVRGVGCTIAEVDV